MILWAFLFTNHKQITPIVVGHSKLKKAKLVTPHDIKKFYLVALVAFMSLF